MVEMIWMTPWGLVMETEPLEVETQVEQRRHRARVTLQAWRVTTAHVTNEELGTWKTTVELEQQRRKLELEGRRRLTEPEGWRDRVKPEEWTDRVWKRRWEREARWEQIKTRAG